MECRLSSLSLAKLEMFKRETRGNGIKNNSSYRFFTVECSQIHPHLIIPSLFIYPLFLCLFVLVSVPVCRLFFSLPLFLFIYFSHFHSFNSLCLFLSLSLSACLSFSLSLSLSLSLFLSLFLLLSALQEIPLKLKFVK